jgi:hypothetical protein
MKPASEGCIIAVNVVRDQKAIFHLDATQQNIKIKQIDSCREKMKNESLTLNHSVRTIINYIISISHSRK